MSNIYQNKYSKIFHNNNIFKLKNVLPNKKTKNIKTKNIKKDSFNNILMNKNINNTKKINNNLSCKEHNIHINKSNSNDYIPFILIDKSYKKIKKNKELLVLNLKELSNRLNKIFNNLKKKDYDNIFQKIKTYSFINENKVKKIKNKNNPLINYNYNICKLKQNFTNLKNIKYNSNSINNSKQNIKINILSQNNKLNNYNNNNISNSTIIDNYKNNILFNNLNFIKFNDNDNIKTIQKNDKKESFKDQNNILFQKKVNFPKFKVHKEIISSYDNINYLDKINRNKIIKIERLIDNTNSINNILIKNDNKKNKESNNINIIYENKYNLFNSLNNQNICYSENNIKYDNEKKLNKNNIINVKKIFSNNKNKEQKEIIISNNSSFYDSIDSEYENEIIQPKKGWLFLKIISFIGFHFLYRNLKKKFVIWKKLSNIKDKIIVENILKYKH